MEIKALKVFSRNGPFFAKLVGLSSGLAACQFLASGHEAAAATATIHPEEVHQEITGFGASIDGTSEARWPAYKDPAFLDFVAHELGMSILRMQIQPGLSKEPIPNPEDIHYEGFEFDSPDGAGVAVTVQFARELIGRRTDFKVIGTVWSPPGWMKDSGKSNGTQSGFILNRNRGYDNDNRLSDDRYSHFAKFLFEYDQFLKAEGTPLIGMSPQNELMFTQYFDSCMYTGEEYARIVREVGRRFESENVQRPLIFGPEDMTFVHYEPGNSTGRHNPYVENLMAEDTQAYFDVWATHGYSDGVNSGQASEPETYWENIKQFERPYWITEGGTGNHEWPQPVTTGIGEYIHHALTGGNSGAFVAWQLNGTTPSGHSIMGFTHATKKTYTAMHFWRYIRPGYVRIGAELQGLESQDLRVSAFKDPLNPVYTIVAINTAAVQRMLSLNLQDSAIEALDTFRTSATEDFAYLGALEMTNGNLITPLPAHSITTFTVLTAVSGLSISISSLELEVDLTERIPAGISPIHASNQRTFWSSSDPQIASVNGAGYVTGHQPGTVVISARTEDGDFRESVQVEVKPRQFWPWGEWTAIGGHIDTGRDFLGPLYNAYGTDWIYSFEFDRWIFIPGDHIGSTHAWAWFPDPNGITRAAVQDTSTSADIPQFESATEALTNVAAGKTVIVQASSGEALGDNLTDGNISTEPDSRWSVEGYPQEVLIDLEGIFEISSFRLYPLSGRSYQYTVDASTDGLAWERIVDRSSNSGTSTVWLNVFDSTARFVRVNITGGGSYTGDWVSIGEMQIYGAAAVIAPTGITLSHRSLMRGVGQTWQLSAILEPWFATEREIAWSSSNTNFATVDEEGRVTATGIGTAILTATTVSGNLAATATIDVTDESHWTNWVSAPDGNVDTGSFLGVIFPLPGSDWIYVYSLDRWILLPESTKRQTGAWGQIYRRPLSNE